MDIKDSYLHSSVGVVKSIDVNADILTYKLADSNKTSINVTLPTATISTNGLLSKNDKQLLTIYQSVINVVNDPSSVAILHIKDVYASVDYVHLYVSNLDNSRKDRPLVLQNGFGNVGIGTPAPSEKLEVIGNIKATSFIGNVSSDQITLTNYTKATTTSPIATTDSLTTALGKLEYKTDFIYSDLLGGNDNDDIINKWGEIVDFIKNVKEGADITDEFVTRKTAQTITGVKTFEGKSENSGDIVVPLILKNSGWQSHISTAIDFYNGNNYKEPNARISTYMDGGGTRGGTLIFYTQQQHNINPNPKGLTERLRIGDDGITKINGDLTLTGKGHITNQLTVKSDSPNLTPKIEFNEYYTSTSSWNSYIASDYYGTNICSTENFTHGLYIILGREGFGNLNILDNNKTPIARISKTKGHYFNGNMSVTGDITANKFITKNGTSSQFVKGDGSLSTGYIHNTLNANRLSYSTATSLSYTALSYLTFTPNDAGGKNSYILIADLGQYDGSSDVDVALIGSIYGYRMGNQSLSAAYNIVAQAYYKGSYKMHQLYTNMAGGKFLVPQIVRYNGNCYLALLKRSSTTTVYFIGYAKGLLNNPINTDSVDEVLYTRSNFDSNNNLIYSITTDYLNTNGTDYKIIHSGNSSVSKSGNTITITLGSNSLSFTNLGTSDIKTLAIDSSRPSDANYLAGKEDGGIRQFKASSSMTSHKPEFDGTILNFSWDNTAGFDSQLCIANGGYNSSKTSYIQWRGQDNGTWGDWKTVAFLNESKGLTLSGGLTLYSASGDSPHLLFQRGNTTSDDLYDWDIYDSSGHLRFRYNNKGTWTNNISFGTGGITATAFIKSGGTSSQFLKADGSTSVIYAPTTSGSEGQVLVSNGTGKDPIWSNGVKFLANYYSSRPSSIDPGLYGGGQMLQFKSTSTAKDDPAYPGDGNILHFNWDTTGKYNSQIFLHCSGQSLKIRGMNGTNWTDWKSVMFTDSPLNSTSIIESKTYSLSSANWTNTGKTFENVATGTYAIQVTSGTNLVASGIMSIYKNLSDTTEDEIPLHVHSTAGWRPYLRTYGNKLQISSNDNDATNRTVTIKIAQIL